MCLGSAHLEVERDRQRVHVLSGLGARSQAKAHVERDVDAHTSAASWRAVCAVQLLRHEKLRVAFARDEIEIGGSYCGSYTS